MQRNRFSVPTFAFGAFLVVFFVQPLAEVRSNPGNLSDFSPIEVQNVDCADADDSARKTDNAAENTSADFNENAVDAASENAPRWFRLDRNARNVPTELSTSIVRYSGRFRGDDGEIRDVSVDLIGAIHVAEPEYYAALNEAFREYETVVFELVVGRGVDVRATIEENRNQKPQITGSPFDAISLSQQALGAALGLTYQIDGIDYLAPNMRRGDAFAEDFLLKILSNGDVPNFLFDAFLQAALDRSAGQTAGWALACAVAKDKRTAFRRLVANELAATELTAPDESEISFPENADDAEKLNKNERENALIHYRDEFAIKAAQEELAAGKTKIAIFFGVAHLPDLARRLETQLGLTRDGEPRWLPAWTMNGGR